MFCQKCGTENPDDATFCNKCGAAMKAVAVPTPAPIVSVPEIDKKKSYAGLIVGILILAAILGGAAYYVLSNNGHYAYVAVHVHSTHITETVDVQIIIDDEVVDTYAGLKPGQTYYPEYYFAVKFGQFVDSKIITVKVISTGGGLGSVTDSEDVIIQHKGEYTVDLYI